MSCTPFLPILDYDDKYYFCTCGNHIFSSYTSNILKPYRDNKYKLYKNNKRCLIDFDILQKSNYSIQESEFMTKTTRSITRSMTRSTTRSTTEELIENESKITTKMNYLYKTTYYMFVMFIVLLYYILLFRFVDHFNVNEP